MLENLRRKSLAKTYHDPIHQVHFESGLAKYDSSTEIDVCTPRIAKKSKKRSFSREIDIISSKFFSFFELMMIACPSGSFTMGHEDQDDNKPRTVIIERPFLLGETEITQELYEKVMNTNPSRFKNPQNPVERVSWQDAILFCNELSRLQGLDECYFRRLDSGWSCDSSKNDYRLPEEKEWEYAAKAGTQNRWVGTDDPNKIGEYAWFGENSTVNNEWQTHTVKKKKPNEWGFYDMSGNVEEWCEDKYKLDASEHSVRGGSWDCYPPHLRSAYRSCIWPGNREHDLGFRVARSIVN